ncbi:Integrin beta-like protein 1 [Liparis tanakae]|uniref:Integrin beta-like protein 1 n=1 Tax=Liparis tanakae TaxID=230148 RepID=A0A4Z2F927_9TELE|nr:Integrin beta-like protein 1 [Liparis tanakae]
MVGVGMGWRALIGQCVWEGPGRPLSHGASPFWKHRGGYAADRQPASHAHRHRGYCDCGTCECDDGWSGEACQFPEECDLPGKKSKELCRNPQGVVCSNRGSCHCGSCMCDQRDPRGLVTGRFCQCDDSECHGQCYCGNCYCAAGWHGDKCEYQCDISPWESKRRCTSPDGKICSNRGILSFSSAAPRWRATELNERIPDSRRRFRNPELKRSRGIPVKLSKNEFQRTG